MVKRREPLDSNAQESGLVTLASTFHYGPLKTITGREHGGKNLGLGSRVLQLPLVLNSLLNVHLIS